MRVIIAGSSGLIGSHLVPELRTFGHEVRTLVRRRPRSVNEYEWDPEVGTVPREAVADADAIVNLCGAGIAERPWTASRKRLLLHSRVRPTTVLARSVVEHGIPILLNASAVGFYGDTGAQPVTESGPSGTSFTAHLCQRWEEATRPATAVARVVCLRTGLVLASSGGLLGSLRLPFSLGLGTRLGSGTQFMPWISVQDEIAAIRFVLENQNIAGPVNLSGPTPVTNAVFTRALGDVMRRPTPWVVPAFVLRLALGELAGELLGGQRALPSVLERHGFTFQHATLSAALSAALT